MKFLAFADLHIHNFKQFDKQNSRLKNCLLVLKLMFAYANKYNITNILFAGDFFDKGASIPTIVLNETVLTLKELFNKYPDIQLICVSGNHDYATTKYLNEPVVTALTFLETIFTNFIVIDDTFISLTDNIKVFGVPYYDYPIHYYTKVDSFSLNKSHINILLTHATITGFTSVPGQIESNHECFKRFNLCLCGDIHEVKWMESNMLMMGNPLHKDFSDEGQSKGFWLFDIDESTHLIKETFITTDSKFPKFVRKKVSDVSVEEDNKNYIQITPDIIDNIELKTNNENFTLDKKPEEIITKYLEEIDNNDIDLLNIGLTLIKHD